MHARTHTCLRYVTLVFRKLYTEMRYQAEHGVIIETQPHCKCLSLLFANKNIARCSKWVRVGEWVSERESGPQIGKRFFKVLNWTKISTASLTVFHSTDAL